MFERDMLTPELSTQHPATNDGFTLTELLITVLIMGLIIGALTSAVIVGLKNNDTTRIRLGQSHDAQMAEQFFATDVQGAMAGTTGVLVGAGTAKCGSDPSSAVVIQFVGSDFDPSDNSAVTRAVTYVTRTVTSVTPTENQLVRLACSTPGTSAPANAPANSEVVLVHSLGSVGTIGCKDASGAVQSVCDSPATVSLPVTEQSSQDVYNFTLVGHRRTT